MSSACPPSRGGHAAAVIGHEMLLWGGAAPTRGEKGGAITCPPDLIECFNLLTCQWKQRRATSKSPSDIPQPCSDVGIGVVQNRHIYQFGGHLFTPEGGSVYFNDVHKLDGLTLEWQGIVPTSQSTPTRRSLLGLCVLGQVGDEHLVVMGGYGTNIVPQTAEFQFNMDLKYDSFGYTNDVWFFSIRERNWILAQCSGNKPRPRGGHTFTAVDSNRAILICGFNTYHKLFHDAFLFKFSSREWIEMKLDDSLIPRCNHSTVVVYVPSLGPVALVLWGFGKNGFPLSVAQRVVIDSRRCEKVRIDDEPIPTGFQSVCSVVRGRFVFLLRYGGTPYEFREAFAEALLDILKYDFKKLLPHDLKKPIVLENISLEEHELLHELASVMRSRWTVVARFIVPVLSDSEIKEIEVEEKENHQPIRFLNAWIGKHGLKATREALCSALFSADLGSGVKEVFPEIYEKMTKVALLEPDINIERDELVYDEEKDFLGGGGFGEVYRGTLRRKGNETLVAVKVFFDFRKRKTEKEYEMLRRESSILLRIKPHDNVLRLIGLCAVPRHYALVTEFVNGGSLSSLLQSSDHEDAVSDWQTRITFAKQIAQGMIHLHYNYPSIIHQDLKSQNVLVSISPNAILPFTCKVADFGLSKMPGISSITTRQRSSSVHPGGTVTHVAPERYLLRPYGDGDDRSKMDLARKADVYSYGVLLWEIREREIPYKGISPEVIRLNVKAEKQLPEGDARDVPPYFNNLLERCVKFVPQERPMFRDILLAIMEAQQL